MTSFVDTFNRGTMHSPAAIKEYTTSQSLTPAEQASLDRVRAEARGQPILDIGIGAGRTIGPLRQVSENYLGIDYSEAMLETARPRYPGVRLEYADARDMQQVADNSIFLVMFSCNGIGMVGHEDRLAIMREVFRVLRPGGVFLFSNHNQNSPVHAPGFRFPELKWSWNPARLGIRAWRFARDTVLGLPNYLRLSKLDVRGPEYSIINDSCHNYSTMLYYITLRNQRRQLEQIGFAPGAEAYDMNGKLITDDTAHVSIAFVARKPG